MRMSWREYQLRRSGYLRQDRNRWIHTREIAYASLIGGGAVDPKKLKKEQYMPIDNEEEKVVITKEHRAVFDVEWQNYLNEVKEKQCRQN